MKYIMTLILAVALYGCDLPPRGMTNAEIITEIKTCTEAGLDSQHLISGLNFHITRIQCVPYKDQRPCKEK